MRTGQVIVLLANSLALYGCISTQEMPLAPNVVRIDTQAGGLLFRGQAAPATMRAAANATIERGYTHFRFENVSAQQSTVGPSVVAGSNSTANANYGPGYVNVSSSTTGAATFVRNNSATASATVFMFHANDPGAQGAFDATDVLRQYKLF